MSKIWINPRKDIQGHQCILELLHRSICLGSYTPAAYKHTVAFL